MGLISAMGKARWIEPCDFFYPFSTPPPFSQLPSLATILLHSPLSGGGEGWAELVLVWGGQGLPLEAAVSERWQVIGQSLGDIQQERQEVLELGACSLNYLISVQLQRETDREREEGERLGKTERRQ